MLADAVLSAALNVLVLAGIPFLLYSLYHKLRHRRTLPESARRAGLRMGEARYIGYCALAALVGVAILVLWPPPLAPFVREGSPQRAFVGLGLGGVGFPLVWANVLQALIFLLPHFLVLLVMPEMWPILPVVFAGALFAGWVRIRSDSIVGPWLLHASVNVAICLSVAARSASQP